MAMAFIDPYAQELVAFMLLVLPALFYIMALYEDRKGTWLFGVGIGLHLASIAERWMYTGLIPLSEKRDNISFMALCIAALYLTIRARRGTRGLINVLAPITICGLLVVATGFRTMDSISPFMQTPWFYGHVIFYFASYAMFALSACYGVTNALAPDDAKEWSQYRLASVGWIHLSASLICGSIWFYIAYGHYWLWTSKELWITTLWLYYGVYLHARLMPELRGRTAAIIGALGFAVALFTYFGVGAVIPSPPTQF